MLLSELRSPLLGDLGVLFSQFQPLNPLKGDFLSCFYRKVETIQKIKIPKVSDFIFRSLCLVSKVDVIKKAVF
jgi:hypothetical protein